MLDEEQTLEEIREMTEENNKMLRSLRRTARVGAFFKFFYWMVILGAGIGAFYYIQPYLEELQKVYSNILDAQKKVQEIPKSFSDFFKGNKEETKEVKEVK